MDNTLLAMFSPARRKKITLVAFLLLVFATALFMSGCKKDKDPEIPPGTGVPTLEAAFSAKANTKDFHLNDSFTLAAEGFNYTVDVFKFYVSNLRLVRTADSTEVLLKDIALIDFRKDKASLSFKADQVPEGSYKAVVFGIGVDSVNNAKLPSSFPAGHPLSSAQGTYWDMASMYRFIIMEGRLDTAALDTIKDYNVPFALHTGTNVLYRTKTIQRNITIAKDTKLVLNFELDMDAVLSNSNLKNDPVTHTMGNMPLAQKISDNLVAAISLK